MSWLDAAKAFQCETDKICDTFEVLGNRFVLFEPAKFCGDEQEQQSMMA